MPRFCFSLLPLPASSVESSHTFIATAVVGTVEFTNNSSSGTVLLSVAIVCSSDSSLVPSFVREPFSVMSISFNDLDFPPVSLFFSYSEFLRQIHRRDTKKNIMPRSNRISRNRRFLCLITGFHVIQRGRRDLRRLC